MCKANLTNVNVGHDLGRILCTGESPVQIHDDLPEVLQWRRRYWHVIYHGIMETEKMINNYMKQELN